MPATREVDMITLRYEPSLGEFRNDHLWERVTLDPAKLPTPVKEGHQTRIWELGDIAVLGNVQADDQICIAEIFRMTGEKMGHISETWEIDVGHPLYDALTISDW